MTEQLNTEGLFVLFDETSSKLLQLVSSFSTEEIHQVASIDCWTAAQLSEHIIKSTRSIAQVLAAKGKITEREPDLRVLELKELFLDFTKKFQSPESVLPTRLDYRKEMIIEDLEKSIKQVRERGNIVNLFETAEIPGFGILTKLELVHFIIYHTQRHVKQLENIGNQKNFKDMQVEK